MINEMRRLKTATLLDTSPTSFSAKDWLGTVFAKEHANKLELVNHAIEIAQVAAENHKTPLDLPCLHQGLLIAEILALLPLDPDLLAAAICYPAVQYAGLNLDDIKEQLNPTVAKLIEGTQRMEAMHNLHHQSPNRRHPAQVSIDNLRKMMLAMVSDVRVVLLKLAEQLCLLRHCQKLATTDQLAIAKETMDIYAPLANRLGVGQLKWELEDLALHYIEPEAYLSISKSLKSRRSDREQYVQIIVNILIDILSKVGMKNFQVTGRVKHIYSIYRKMQRKKVDVEKIYDATAVRILVSSVEECYAVLGHVYALWKPIPHEFDDYIMQPKPNGYRSLHTCVVGLEDKHVEIQIRTHAMHEESELGVAAHWKYKEGATGSNPYENKIGWLRQLMAWQKEVSFDEQSDQKIYQQIFTDRVYVFTPAGDILDLQKGATPLDFAYHLHSEIGNRCRGAKVNGHLVNFSHILQTGDRVEILTAKQGHPSRDWLNPELGYLYTARAKAKVHHWFRQQELEQHPHPEPEPTPTKTLPAAPPPIPSYPRKNTGPTDVSVQGIGNVLTHIAQCCKPIPGDTIIGYVSLSRGVMIHRLDCPNVSRNKEKHVERLTEVNWEQATHKKYPVDIAIDAIDDYSVIRDITGLCATEHVSIIALNRLPNKKTQHTCIQLTLEIDSVHPLAKILTQIKQLPQVLTAKRLN